jgi:serine phosphatase RsbU (regulator of sigma subunit)
MTHSKLSLWRFVVSFYPLFAVFVLAQWVMRVSGNTIAIAIPWWLSVFDFIFFIVVFSSAAVWVFAPLKQAKVWLNDLSYQHRHYLEQGVMLLPSRAFKAFLFAGFGCALLLLIVLTVGAEVHHVLMTPRMLIALLLSLLYGVGILAPSVALVMTLSYMVALRRELSSKGLFLQSLNDKQGLMMHWGNVARRPWLIFMITSVIPASILAFFVYLILGADTVPEQRFILLQAGVLFVVLMCAGAWLIFTAGRVLAQVMASFSDGLERMRQGQFGGQVPILMDDEFGALAQGMNTAFSGLKEREELKHSLEIAADIHHTMLPSVIPNIQGYTLDGFQQSCEAVGGDYYDYIVLPDGRVWLVIADVAGKGYPAALTVANLRAMLHALAHLAIPFEKAAAYVNNTLCETLTGGRFVTLFMAKLQPETHSLLWLNAGHVPALLSRGDELEALEAASPPMGLQPDLDFKVSLRMLKAGDVLLAYTDGITEARNHKSQEMFGEKRVRDWLKVQDKSDISRLCKALRDEVDDFGHIAEDDDVTILCLKRNDE